MSYEPQTLDLFSVEQGALPIEDPKLSGHAATAKQISYATSIASKVGVPAPTSLFSSSSDLSAWINQYKPKPPSGRFANYPSSKQVAFAERIAQLKRAQVPHECFRDKTLMSRWIDNNKPR